MGKERIPKNPNFIHVVLNQYKAFLILKIFVPL